MLEGIGAGCPVGLLEGGMAMKSWAIGVVAVASVFVAGCAGQQHPKSNEAEVGIVDTAEGLFGGMPHQYLVTFDPDSARINPDDAAELRKLAKDAAETDAPSVLLEGHSDKTDRRGAAKPLSVRRAEAVRTLFEAEGVAKDRIIVEGVGADEPVNQPGFVFADAPHNRVVMIAIYPNRSRKTAPKVPAI